MYACQIIMVLLLIANLLYCLYMDFHGRTARLPGGFAGAVTTLIVSTLTALVYWKAGAFSELLK
jgi:hypothetical protein